MSDLFLPFIYKKSKPEVSNQIELQIEEFPIIQKEDKTKEDEEKVAIIEIL